MSVFFYIFVVVVVVPKNYFAAAAAASDGCVAIGDSFCWPQKKWDFFFLVIKKHDLIHLFAP